jgi:hypothetical protein
METTIKIILTVAIITLIVLLWFKIPVKQELENLITMEDVPHIKPNSRAPKINPHFIEAQFHQDYMDVISAFNDISPNQRQIFNINNISCQVTHGGDIETVGKMVNDFVDSINNDIHKNVPLVHTANSGWDEVLPEHSEKSGWEKVQESLGLPISLYNKPKLNTKVHLVQFFDVTKYETEKETKYTCKIVISKEQVKDKLVIQVSFVHPIEIKDVTNIILETISVVGFLTTHGSSTDRIPTDDFYYFDSLEKNNMITGRTVATELMKKYKLRQDVMQEQIDGMELDVKEKYAESPTNADYNSYKVTQTIFDDMLYDKVYD